MEAGAAPPKQPGRTAKGGRGVKPTSAPAPGGAGGGVNPAEDHLLEVHAGGLGKGTGAMPTTLMFDHVSPATRLLEKRRQMFEVQEALNSQKDEFARREDAFRRREDALRRKDLELQESLIKFNKFLQENESKRNRALKRAAEERKQREAKESDIERLEAELADKLREEMDLKEKVEHNIQYQDFLESLCQSMAKYFPEISDVLNRHETLVKANADLLKNQLQQESAVETLQREYFEYKKEVENQELNSNNTIAELQAALEIKRAYAAALQFDVDKAISETGDKALTLGQIISSAHNTLMRCENSYRVRHGKPLAEQNAEKDAQVSLRSRVEAVIGTKLGDIRQFVNDLQSVKEEFKTYSRTRLLTGGDGSLSGGGVGLDSSSVFTSNTVGAGTSNAT